MSGATGVNGREQRRAALAERLTGGHRTSGPTAIAFVDQLTDNIARLIFLGNSVEEISQELAVEAQVIGRVIASPEYTTKIRELRMEADAQAIDAATLIKKAQGEAVLTAKHIMRNGTKESNRLSASFGLLARGGHGPKQQMPGNAGLLLSEAVAQRLVDVIAELPRVAQAEILDGSSNSD